MNNIKDWRELRVGQTIWHTYLGLRDTARPYTVVGSPRRFEDHRTYDSIHSSQRNSIVFDVRDSDGRMGTHFAGDGNLVPGRSHNKNYWWRTEQDARGTPVTTLDDVKASYDAAVAAMDKAHAMAREFAASLGVIRDELKATNARLEKELGR